MRKVKNLIIGSGMSGLGAALALKNDFLILEKNSFIGGLCSSFEINGFTFDNAVHLSFSNDNIFNEYIKNVEVIRHHPFPINWFENRWIKHPLQNNLSSFSEEFKFEALKSFDERPTVLNVDNFKDWSISQYGVFIFKNIIEKYNLKYWITELNRIGIDWIGNRLYSPTRDEIIFGMQNAITKNTYYAKEMRYPINGGYGAFITELSSKLLDYIELETEVISIDVDSKVAILSNKERIQFDQLYSSIPLPKLMTIINPAPLGLLEKSNKLEVTSVVIVSFIFRCEILLKDIWFYIYDDDILAARAYFPANKSKNNAPLGSSSIQFEIYFKNKDSLPADKEIINNCLYAIEKLNIEKLENVEFVDLRVLEYGNVVMLKENKDIIFELKTYLNTKGIQLIGRFGEWDYLWSDQSFMSGYNKGRGKHE